MTEFGPWFWYLPAVQPWVNQSLERTLNSENTATRAALQGYSPTSNETWKGPAFAPVTVLVLGRCQWSLLSIGKGHGTRGLSSSLGDVGRIVQCLPESYLGNQKRHTYFSDPTSHKILILMHGQLWAPVSLEVWFMKRCPSHSLGLSSGEFTERTV